MRFLHTGLILLSAIIAARLLGNKETLEVDLAIREAGPQSMFDPPSDWDMTDEKSDGSFPASDPPGNY